jgi:membrane protease YdiL (CAAX protease family)
MKKQPLSLKGTFRAFDLWISLGVCFLIQLLGVQILLPLFNRFHPSFSWVTISFIFTTLAFLIPLIYLTIRYGCLTLSDFILGGQDLIVLFLAILFLFLFASAYILIYGVRVSPAFTQMTSKLGISEYVVVLFIVLLFVPFLEETFFRRYVFELFRSRYRLSIAILLTVGFETFLHIGYNIEQLFIIFIFSFGLTIAYLKSRLATAVIIHCLINILFSFP